MTPQQRYYRKNRERILAKAREYYAKNGRDKERDHKREAARVRRLKSTPEGWLHYALIHAKHRAKKKGIEFSVTAEDIHLPTHCPVFGVELRYQYREGRGQMYMRASAPSLDRKDNKKGYVPGNTIVVSGRANALKSDASTEELEQILRYMKEG